MSTKLLVDDKDRKLDNQDALVKKITRTKIKAKIKAFASPNIDKQYYQSNCLTYLNLAQAQTQIQKDKKGEKSKLKPKKFYSQAF